MSPRSRPFLVESAAGVASDASHSIGARILAFWFTHPDSPEWNRYRKAWFSKSDAFDDSIRRNFLAVWEAALAAKLNPWGTQPLDDCARIVLLDQFPRNMFRHQARAFATDALALAVARRAVETGADLRLPTPYHRFFCYMPFEHAESLEDQDTALRLMIALREDTAGAVDQVEWAVRHRDVIARFGRFPHRNAVLGRTSTPEESVFLREPGSSF